MVVIQGYILWLSRHLLLQPLDQEEEIFSPHFRADLNIGTIQRANR